MTLSVTESESISAVQCAQDMLFVMWVLESLGLQVEKPMVLMMNNRGAIGLFNNWSVAGRTCHLDVRYNFMRELKESDMVTCVWLSGEEMSSDVFTKNLGGRVFAKHTKKYCGDDEYDCGREGAAEDH